jgi:hypothetical protein
LYFAADAYCRDCVGRARRAWAARIGGGVVAVLLTLAGSAGVMLAAIPTRGRTVAVSPPPPTPSQIANCTPSDVWLDQAARDLGFGRYHAALHHLALSQRDCPHTARRDQLYALAYDGVGDQLAAIAAASRWVDSSGAASDACALFLDVAHPRGANGLEFDSRCRGRFMMQTHNY